MTAPSGPSPRLPETYRDCLDFLFARNQFAVKLGLDNVKALLDRLGRPQDGMVFLHVAGTNGKGSVCANLAAMLRAAGYARVGLYTSPHLVSFRERILVDDEPVPADWSVAWLRRALEPILDLQATYFECVTAMALDYFRFRACSAAVLETGLGGRLDATNAVLPALTAVTSVSLDHTSILGDSVEAIWREKIGILKPGVPMVTAERRPALLADLAEKAAAMASPLFAPPDPAWVPGPSGPADLEPALTFPGKYDTYRLPSSLRPEDHQRDNLALSILAAEVFLGGPLPPPDILAPALRSSRVPGRTQLLEAPGMLPLILDGAHNPGGMEALGAYLARAYAGKRIMALFSMMGDKDFAGVYRRVAAFADEIRFLPLEGKFPRALRYADLEAALEPSERHALRPFPLEAGALRRALRLPDRPSPGERFDLVVACGSLYLLGEVIPMLLPCYEGLAWFRQFEGEG